METVKYLFQKYIDNTLDDEDIQKLTDWIAQSPNNKRIFVAFAKLHKNELQQDAASSIDMTHSLKRLLSQQHNASSFYSPMRWIAAAIVLAVGISVMFTWQNAPKNVPLVELFPVKGSKKAILTLSDGSTLTLDAGTKPIFEANGLRIGQNEQQHLHYVNTLNDSNTSLKNSILVPNGGSYSVSLSDGSKIWINANSAVEYPLVFGKERVVYLKGEAFFEVQSNEESPFIVQTSQIQIRVTGTRFNVRAYHDDSITVTLVEGNVNVISSQGNFELKPGEQLEMTPTQTTINHVNPIIYASWTTGMFEFENTSLEEIAQQLSLWYGVKFHFEDNALQQIKFSGAILKDKSLGYALELIQKVSQVDFDKQDDTIIIRKK
ncbi:MAG: FecR family protein [Capnocytophaga sp.]|nr:FecR family protein [Capnocytophaga sp.]